MRTSSRQGVGGLASDRAGARAKSRARASRRRAGGVRGFTLIELLVALFLLAVLGTAGFQMLFQITATRDAIARQSDRLNALQRTFYWLAEDVTQIIDRPVRSAVDAPLPPLMIDIAEAGAFELTRGGWTNPAGDVMPPRSSLQRVAWRLEEDRLLRSYWYHLDPIDEAPTRRRQLLDGVEAMTLRFMDVEGEWQDSWPPRDTRPEDEAGLPAALEVTLALADLGDVVRVFALPR